MIDQVGGRLHHAPGPATGTEPSALAAERHQMFVTAAVALDTQEPVLQPSALQVGVELLSDEFWQVAAGLFNCLNEAWVMLGNNGVKSSLFRPMEVIDGSGGKRG